MFLLQFETFTTQEAFLRGNKAYPWSDNFKTTHTYTYTYSHMQYDCQRTNRTETFELYHHLHGKSRLQVSLSASLKFHRLWLCIFSCVTLA